MTQKYTLEAIKTKSQNVKGALGRRAQGGNIKNSMCNRSIPSPFGIIFLRLYTISHKKAIFQALKIWKGFVVSPIYNQTNIFRKVKSVHKQNEAQEIVRSVLSHHHSASYFSDYTLFPTKKQYFRL